VRQGQVDVGLVQEPALTLIERAGGRVLVNGMDIKDAERFLGGAYEFMGVAVRTPEIPARREEMQKIARALGAALPTMQTLPPEDLLKALPRELTTGADVKEITESLARHRASLYPTAVTIDLESSKRVADSLKVAGLLQDNVDPSPLFDTSVAKAG
jgi:NitT/TauT family transport system substrate-binding protein